MKSSDGAAKQDRRLLAYGSFVLAVNIVGIFTFCCILIAMLANDFPVRGIIFATLMLTFLVSVFALVLHYANELHRELPNAYTYWEKYAMLFIAPLRLSAPETDFGKAFAPKLSWLRINIGILFFWFFFGIIIFMFTPIGIK